MSCLKFKSSKLNLLSYLVEQKLVSPEQYLDFNKIASNEDIYEFPFYPKQTRLDLKSESYGVRSAKEKRINELLKKVAIEYYNLPIKETDKFFEKVTPKYEDAYYKFNFELLDQVDARRKELGLYNDKLMANAFLSKETKFEDGNQVKTGVEKIFNENPELASIGTPQQYSAYLDNIFPDSKVNKIVYHGVVEGKASYDNILKNGFDFKSKRNWDDENSNFKEGDNTGMFFSDYTTASLYGEDVAYKLTNEGEYQYVNYKNIVAAILNIKYLDSSQETASDTAAAFYNQNKDKEAIGMLGPEGGSEGSSLNYVVFEPEQIHILGNKQDIEGFKKFVKDDKANLDTTIEDCGLPS